VAQIVIILIAACAGKLLGGFGTSRASGLSTRQSAIMGSLMNTRGLIELVVLQVALSAGVLDNRLFSELVVMAVCTTMMTPPLLSLLMRRKVGVAADPARADLLALPAR
jgi:Kef-type K+ transport system membrane component KefB